jgi:hypothetical protein
MNGKNGALPFFDNCMLAQNNSLSVENALGINLKPQTHPDAKSFKPIPTTMTNGGANNFFIDPAFLERNQGQRPTLKQGVCACLILQAGLRAQRMISCDCALCDNIRACRPERRKLPNGLEGIQILRDPLEV